MLNPSLTARRFKSSLKSIWFRHLHPHLASRRILLINARSTLIGVGLAIYSHPTLTQADGYEISSYTTIIGSTQSVQIEPGDTRFSLAHRYDLGLDALKNANPTIDFRKPLVTGTVIIIPKRHLLPKKHQDIVINLAEKRLYFFVDKTHVLTYPVGIAGEGWDTPIGDLTIIQKHKNPTWFAPKSVLKMQKERYGRNLPAVIPPGPDNPLGKYALRLSKPNFLIHGTNDSRYVGTRVTAGCYRMYPEDIAELFSQVQVGTKVTIVNHPVKLEFTADHAYMEVHPTVRIDSSIPLIDGHRNWLDDELHLPLYMANRLLLWSQENRQYINNSKIHLLLRTPTGIPQTINESIHDPYSS